MNFELGISTPGLAMSFLLNVVETIWNGNVAHGLDNAYLSFIIEKRNANRSLQHMNSSIFIREKIIHLKIVKEQCTLIIF